MKKKRLIGVILIIVALIVMMLPVTKADAETSANDFVIKGNKLIKYTGKEKQVTIPETVDAIGESAFEGNLTVEKVVLSHSVKNIEAYAFWGCDNLSSIVLGKGISKIGEYTFAGCKGLQRIDLPANISSIGAQAFGDCINLTDITIPPETVSIHDSAFDGCGKLEIHCEEGTVADEFARKFYEKQKEFAEYEDVPNYNEDAENTGGQEQDREPNDVSSGDVNQEIEKPVEKPHNLLSSTKVVGNQAVIFWDTSELQVVGGEDTGVTLPNSSDAIVKMTVVDEKVIADQAYYKKKFENTVQISEGIEEIGEFAFARSTVENIILPEGLKRIDYGAFYHCDSLNQIDLPDTLIKIEPKAFEYTPWVESFMEGNEPFLISGGVLVAYNGNDEEIVIPDGVRVIASGVFNGHTEINKVILPDTLEYIGEESFQGCSSLREIALNEGIKKIEDRAFYDCDSLKEISVPATVIGIGLDAFDDINYTCLGAEPAFTYENTATRLSNAAYRGIQTTEEQILDIEGNLFQNVKLNGAKGKYKLCIEEGDYSHMETAWKRIHKESLPGNMDVYQITLTDESDIPIYKLGKCYLEFVIPLKEEFTNYETKAVQIDRNGQLQSVFSERVLLDGSDALYIKLNYISEFGVYCTEKEDVGSAIYEIKSDMSVPHEIWELETHISMIKPVVSLFLLFVGIYLVLTGNTTKRIRTKLS